VAGGRAVGGPGRPPTSARAARRAGDSGGRPVAAGPATGCCAATAARRGRGPAAGRGAVHLVNTDPPYNVKGRAPLPQRHRPRPVVVRGPPRPGIPAGRAGRGRPRRPAKKLRARDRPLANDFVGDDEFGRLLRAWFGNLARVLLPGRGFYIWGGYSNVGNYPRATGRVRPVLLAGHHLGQAAPVLTAQGLHGGAPSGASTAGGRGGPPVSSPKQRHRPVSIKKSTRRNMVHLTEKPVELAARALAYSSRRGENVLDLFGGSGST